MKQVCKLNLLLFALIVYVHECQAQDTIFTTKGDTILVDIKYMERNKIYYTKFGGGMLKGIKKKDIDKTVKDIGRSDLSRNLQIVSSDGCLLARDEIDKFTGAKVVETTEKFLHQYFEQKIILSFKKQDSIYLLNMKYKNEELRNLDVEMNGLLRFTLENDKVVEVFSVNHFSEDRTYTEPMNNYSSWVAPIYRIREDQVREFAQSAIKEVVVYFKEGFSTHNDLPRSYKRNIQQLAICIMNN